mgnify:CR=1 FL=1
MLIDDNHEKAWLMHGCFHETTQNIENSLVKSVAALTDVREKTRLVRRGSEALIALESSKRSTKLGGTGKGLRTLMV